MIPVLCFFAVLVIEYKGFQKRRKEYRELEHFAEFLSDLKDCFFLCKNVTESIFQAMEKVPGSLKKRLEEICFLLEEDSMGATALEESFSGNQKYLRLFLIQCRSAVQYGSGKNSTESVFVKNMTELRRDVQNECYQRMQAMYLFSGMGVVVGLPIVFLPVIRWFGSSTMAEMQTFYEGRLGKVVTAVFWILTIGCYVALCMVRQTDKRVYTRPRFLPEVFLWGEYQFENRKIMCTLTGTLFFLGTLILMRGTTMLQKIPALCIGTAAGYLLIVGFYKYLAYLRCLGIDGEVLNLQAAALLLIDVPNITIMELLDVLGACGELFQRTLLRCADSYGAEDEAALRRMYEEETAPAFRQFAGRIMASERIGIKAAFSEIAADRHFFREQLRLDMEQERKKKAANAQVIAFLPMMFLLFAYLIIPFVGISLGQMGEMLREMEQIKYF